MQNNDIQARIRANPKFERFVSMRNSYSVVMSILGAVAYYGFILLVAFNKEFLSQKMGGVTSIGIPIGVGVIVFTIIITWIYVRRANSEFDTINAEIIKEAQK